jgi:hypothetical protein
MKEVGGSKESISSINDNLKQNNGWEETVGHSYCMVKISHAEPE